MDNEKKKNFKEGNYEGDFAVNGGIDSFSKQQDDFNKKRENLEKEELKKSLEAAEGFLGKSKDKEEKKEKEKGGGAFQLTRPTVKTYRDFAVKALKDKPTSLAKMIIKEKKKEELKYEHSVKNKKNILMIILSVVLVFLGVAAVASIIVFGVNKKKEIEEKDKSIAPKSVIYFDYKEEIEMDDMDRSDMVKLSDRVLKETRIPIGDIKIFYFVKRDKLGYKTLASARDFFNLLDTRAGPFFSRNLKDNFSAGIVSTIDSIDPFLIFKISNFDQVYSAMLS